jgi:hypothetical protein
MSISLNGEILWGFYLAELEIGVHFFVFHRLEIEHDSFKMDDQIIGTIRNTNRLNNILFFLTLFTEVILNLLLLCKLVKTVLDVLEVLDIQRQVVEAFEFVYFFFAFHADESRASLPSEDIFY